MNKPQLHLVESAVTGWTTVAPNVQHTPAGGYRVRQRVGGKRITLGVFDTLGEAVAIQTASVQAVAKQGSKGRPTLTTFLPIFLERRKAAGVRSVESERNRARTHLLGSKLARIPLEDVRRCDVLAWTRELEVKLVDVEGQRVGWTRKKAAQDRAAGKTPKRAKRRTAPASKPKVLSHQTRKHCLKLVRGAFDAAVDEGLIRENPVSGIKLRTETRTDDGSTVLTPDEWRRLLAVIPEPERRIVKVALGSGLRQGEQWNLELEDVHLDDPVPWVEVRYGAPGHKPTKSGKPRRVPLVGPALEAMRVWIANLPTWCARPRVLVFPTQRGCHRGPKPPRGWKSWLKAAGIARRVRWHDLRHTCASALVSGQFGPRKWSLEEVKKFLGHSSITTTERYAKFAGDALMIAARETNATST